MSPSQSFRLPQTNPHLELKGQHLDLLESSEIKIAITNNKNILNNQLDIKKQPIIHIYIQTIASAHTILSFLFINSRYFPNFQNPFLILNLDKQKSFLYLNPSLPHYISPSLIVKVKKFYF